MSEKGIRCESWANRSLYLGSNAREIHCTEVWEGEAKRWTMSQETCLIVVRWKLPCISLNLEGCKNSLMMSAFTRRRRIFLWNAERWTPEFIELCMIKWHTGFVCMYAVPDICCFPATNSNTHPPQGSRLVTLSRGKTVKKLHNYLWKKAPSGHRPATDGRRGFLLFQGEIITSPSSIIVSEIVGL